MAPVPPEEDEGCSSHLQGKPSSHGADKDQSRRGTVRNGLRRHQRDFSPLFMGKTHPQAHRDTEAMG